MNVVGLRPRAAAWMIACAGLSWAAGALAGPVGSGGAPLGPCDGVNDVQADASDCSGYVEGNDSLAAVGSIIATKGWGLGLPLNGALTQFKDNRVAVGAGSDNTLFDVVQGAPDGSTGVLTLIGDLTGPFVLTLKGGNEWAAYYYAAGIAHGQTITFDIPGEQGAGLSHASIYAGAATVETGGSNPAGNGVPEPSTLAAALPALAALGWLARRRRRG